jgi:type IV secretory pathway TrbD component
MQQQNNNDLMRYAGMGAQIFASLGIAVFVGYKIDKWLAISFPILVWLLPVLVLTIFIYKLIKETKPKN